MTVSPTVAHTIKNGSICSACVVLNRLGFDYSVNTKGICLRFSKLIQAAQVFNQFQCEHPVCSSLKEIAVMEYCF